MPLAALLDGRRVISSLCEDTQWEEIVTISKKNKERLRMGYSDLPCYPRVSKLGLRHFAHRRGAEASTVTVTAPETPEHLLAKTLIVQTASIAGWTAETEVPADDGSWVADTLLTNGDRRIVVEIQWSRQAEDEYRRRQVRYERGGVECIWLHRHKIESWHRHQYGVPLFHLDVDKDSRSAQVSVPRLGQEDGPQIHRTLTLEAFVIALLTHQIASPSREHLCIWESRCWKCRGSMTCWTLRDGSEEEFFVRNNPLRTMKVRGALRRLREALPDLLELPEFAIPGEAWTKTSGTTYTAFHCPQCKRLQGDWFFMSERPMPDIDIPTELTPQFSPESVLFTPEEAESLRTKVSAIQETVSLMRSH